MHRDSTQKPTQMQAQSQSTGTPSSRVVAQQKYFKGLYGKGYLAILIKGTKIEIKLIKTSYLASLSYSWYMHLVFQAFLA